MSFIKWRHHAVIQANWCLVADEAISISRLLRLSCFTSLMTDEIVLWIWCSSVSAASWVFTRRSFLITFPWRFKHASILISYVILWLRSVESSGVIRCVCRSLIKYRLLARLHCVDHVIVAVEFPFILTMIVLIITCSNNERGFSRLVSWRAATVSVYVIVLLHNLRVVIHIVRGSCDGGYLSCRVLVRYARNTDRTCLSFALSLILHYLLF